MYYFDMTDILIYVEKETTVSAAWSPVWGPTMCG